MTLDARSCETCGAEYTPKVAWQKYCSPRCKNRSKIRRAFKARYTAQNRARLTAYNTAYQRERRARIKAQKADGQ